MTEEILSNKCFHYGKFSKEEKGRIIQPNKPVKREIIRPGKKPSLDDQTTNMK